MSEVKTTGDALDRLNESLNATNVLSDDYKRHITAWAYKAVELADKTAREKANAERESKEADDDYTVIKRSTLAQMQRDIIDMHGAAQTAFHRCACGRLAEHGIICPTNREGGECEAGR